MGTLRDLSCLVTIASASASVLEGASGSGRLSKTGRTGTRRERSSKKSRCADESAAGRQLRQRCVEAEKRTSGTEAKDAEQPALSLEPEAGQVGQVLVVGQRRRRRVGRQEPVEPPERAVERSHNIVLHGGRHRLRQASGEGSHNQIPTHGNRRKEPLGPLRRPSSVAQVLDDGGAHVANDEGLGARRLERRAVLAQV